MMLGRLAALRHAALAPARGVGVRNAATVTSPKPLSIRWDSLMVKCTTAAIIYFVPQDLVFLTGVVTFWHNKAATTAPKKVQADADAALEEWKTKKGLDDLRVHKGSRTWYASFK